ncbi:TPR repeat protein [Minicystis rosea]|nr:TPR repeat protein [Minicystis rosea]
MHLTRSVVALIAAVVLAGCGEPVVVRVVDGRAVPGRFISEYAYALYGRGAEAEAHGDLAGAVRAFALAAEADPESPEIWTRLGSIRCRVAPADAPLPADAQADFARAEQIDAAFGPLWRERARCALTHGAAAEALAAAERAVALDPDDMTSSILRASALERVGRVEEARLVLRALTVRRSGSSEPWRALLDLANRTGDTALAREASPHVTPDRATPSQNATPATARFAAVDAALLADDLAGARRLAHRAKLSWSELAIRAAALGRAALARAQATLILDADPADATARIALAAAADLEGNGAALSASMRAIPARTTSPSPLARLLFAETLARRSGLDAARAWLGPAWETAISSDDPLVLAAAQRMRTRMSAH